MNDQLYILASVLAAIDSAEAILEVYSSDIKVEQKDDNSPLTLADKRSHEIIVDRLAHFDIPILSEEGKNIPFDQRKAWETFFLIDPLDGTKEFIKKNGEFTVNIALIRDRKPVGGVIFVPDKGTLYFALEGIGSHKADFRQIIDWFNGESDTRSRLAARPHGHIAESISELIGCSTKLPIKSSIDRPFTIAGSRSHGTPELEAFVEDKRQEHGEVEFISAGSSLKFCLVAEGRADIYPRTGPTMEWDTAAGQAIVANAGGRVFQYGTDQALIYNKEDLLNPWFVVTR